MFTGLVEGQAQIAGLVPEQSALRLDVEFPGKVAAELELGESVALNGCCLTVVQLAPQRASFQAGAETLSKTNLGRLTVGSPVNFERSLSANARLGGHFVQGHVDGVGHVAEISQDGEWTTLWVQVPQDLTPLMVPKGSITVDGVSLTLVQVQPDRFSVALIPHTLAVTTLGIRQVGDAVNIEVDILGKYVYQMLSHRFPQAGAASIETGG